MLLALDLISFVLHVVGFFIDTSMFCVISTLVSYSLVAACQGYINRLRGYHADEEHSAGFEQGIISSWYYAHKDNFDHMQVYYPVKMQYYAREFPTSWRLIDTGIETSPQ